jgi:hypothetical protein
VAVDGMKSICIDAGRLCICTTRYIETKSSWRMGCHEICVNLTCEQGRPVIGPPSRPASVRSESAAHRGSGYESLHEQRVRRKWKD